MGNDTLKCRFCSYRVSRWGKLLEHIRECHKEEYDKVTEGMDTYYMGMEHFFKNKGEKSEFVLFISENSQ